MGEIFLWKQINSAYTICMNDTATVWRELMRCDDPRLAQIVTITIASMEFDVRCIEFELDEAALRRLPRPQPYVIEVLEDNWHELVSVLNELIAEQLEFDAYLDQRDRSISRNQQRLLIALAVIVGALAVTGAVEL